MENSTLHALQWHCARIALFLLALFGGTDAYAEDIKDPQIVGFTDYKVYCDTLAEGLTYDSLANLNDVGEDGKPNTATTYKLGANKIINYNHSNSLGYTNTYRTATSHEILIDLRTKKDEGRKVKEILLTLKNKTGYFFKNERPEGYMRQGTTMSDYHEVESSDGPIAIVAFSGRLNVGSTSIGKAWYNTEGKTFSDVNVDGNFKLAGTGNDEYEKYAHKATINYSPDSTRLLVTGDNPANSYNNSSYDPFNSQTAYEYLLISYYGDQDLEIGDLRIVTDDPTYVYKASVVEKVGDPASDKTTVSTTGKPVILRVEEKEEFGFPTVANLAFQGGITDAEGFRMVKLLKQGTMETGVNYYQYIPPVGINTTVKISDTQSTGNTIIVNVNTSNGVDVTAEQIFDGTYATNSSLDKAFLKNALKEVLDYKPGKAGGVVIDMESLRNVKAIRVAYPEELYLEVPIYATTYDGKSGGNPDWMQIATTAKGKGYATTGDNTDYELKAPFVQWIDLTEAKLEGLRALKLSVPSENMKFYEIAFFGDKKTEPAAASTPAIEKTRVRAAPTKARVFFTATDSESPWLNYTLEWTSVADNTTTPDLTKWSPSFTKFYGEQGDEATTVMDGLSTSTTYFYRLTATNCFGNSVSTTGWFTTVAEGEFFDLSEEEPYTAIHYLTGKYDADKFKKINNAIKKNNTPYGALMYDMSDVTFEYQRDQTTYEQIKYTLSNEHNPNTFFIVSSQYNSTYYSYFADDQTNLITYDASATDGYTYNKEVKIQDGKNSDGLYWEVYNGGLNGSTGVTPVSSTSYNQTGTYTTYPTCTYTRTTKAPWGTVCLPFPVDVLKYVEAKDDDRVHTWYGAEPIAVDAHSRYYANPQAMKDSRILRYWWPTYIKASNTNDPDSVVFNSGVNAHKKVTTDWLNKKNMTTWTDEDYQKFMNERPQYRALGSYESNAWGGKEYKFPEPRGRRVAIVQFMMDKDGTYTTSDDKAYKTGDEMPVTIKNDPMVGLTLRFEDEKSNQWFYQTGSGNVVKGFNNPFWYSGSKAYPDDPYTCYLTGVLVENKIPQGNYYLPSTADKEGTSPYDNMRLHRAVKDKVLPPFRAYINIPTGATTNNPAGKAKEIVILFSDWVEDENGETTEIRRPATDEELSGLFNIYSINGQLVRHNTDSAVGLPRGLYIINGKKVLVK